MTLKFLQTTPSAAPDLPFQAGQIIHVLKITTEIREWLRTGVAMRLPDPAPEAAVLGPPEETAVLPVASGRGSR